jgi:beta-N-acetylhexosaminidase
VVFSDDLSMAAAAVGGGYRERAGAALEAGCDMVLVCNDQAGAAEVLRSLEGCADPVAQSRIARIHGRGARDWPHLRADARWHEAVRRLGAAETAPDLDLLI